MKANFLISEDERRRILGLHLTENLVHGTSKDKELIKEIQSIVKGTAETLVDIGKNNKVFFQDLKAAMEGIGITGVKSVEEFSAAIKDGKITATDAVKVYSKLFEMNKSLAQEVLATVKESPSFKDLVNLSFPQGKAFLNAEGKLTADAAKKMELIKNYYAKVGLKPEAIEGAIKELKAGGLSSEIKFAGSRTAKIGGLPGIAKVEGSALGKELAQGGLVKDAAQAGIKQGTNVKMVTVVDGKAVIKDGPVELFKTGKEYFIKMPLWKKVASIGAGIGALLAWYATKDSGPQERVRMAFDLCNRVPADKQGEKLVDGNSIADSIYDAIDGLGTDEEALGTAFSQIQSIADMCAVKKAYEGTYGKDIYYELDGDIDSDEDWMVILRPLRTILDAQAQQATTTTQPTPNPTGQGWEKYPCVVTNAKSYDAATNTYKDETWTFTNDGKMSDGKTSICYTCLPS